MKYSVFKAITLAAATFVTAQLYFTTHPRCIMEWYFRSSKDAQWATSADIIKIWNSLVRCVLEVARMVGVDNLCMSAAGITFSTTLSGGVGKPYHCPKGHTPKQSQTHSKQHLLKSDASFFSPCFPPLCSVSIGIPPAPRILECLKQRTWLESL